MAKILVVAESRGDVLDRATLSAITMARQASTLLGGSFDILVIGGPGSASAADGLTCYGAEHVLLAEAPDLSVYLAEKFVGTVSRAARDYVLVVATVTDFGKDLLPRVAGCLDAAYAADCSAVISHNGELSFRRAVYAGNVLGIVTLGTPVRVATARQCEFEAAAPTEGEKSPICTLPTAGPVRAAAFIEVLAMENPGDVPHLPAKIRAAQCSAASHANSAHTQRVAKQRRGQLGEAKTIVSGGRALKEKFFEVLGPLANELDAAIGATRIACNAGYAPAELQVGQSGRIVAPRLYFAVGISGAIQHLAGMKGSKFIVAINKDPQAPIFEFADYGLVADLFKAVPEIVEHIRTHRASGAEIPLDPEDCKKRCRSWSSSFGSSLKRDMHGA
jgi:electron transfer flavoprotein alpha subunit